MVIFAIAGVFHGWAYGESIVGAEPTPLIAYLVGFAATQYVFAIGVGWIVRSVWQAGTPEAIKPRLAGAVAAGVGLAFLIENLEGMLFGA
jgi:urease accessory protein